MKKTSYIAFGGIMAALSLVCLMLTVFPYATFALPALAGLFLIPVIMEYGVRYGAMVFVAIAILALLITPDMEAKTLYVAFFGYYPLLKNLAERSRYPAVEWTLKLGVFNAAIVAAYLWLSQLGLSLDEFAIPGVDLPLQVILALFLFAGNAVFILYDVGLTRIITAYDRVLRPKLRRFLK